MRPYSKAPPECDNHGLEIGHRAVLELTVLMGSLLRRKLVKVNENLCQIVTDGVLVMLQLNWQENQPHSLSCGLPVPKPL